MKDNTEKDTGATPQPHGDHVLGKLTPGSFDTSLTQAPPAQAGSASHSPASGQPDMQKREGSPQKPPAPTRPTGAQPPVVQKTETKQDDALVLPKGALVTLRKSGGLRFTSLQVTVYHNGSIGVDKSPGPPTSTAPHRLRDKDLAQLYRLLGAANLDKLGGTIGQQNPDGYAYEIAADLGQTTHSVTTFDGAVPTQLSPLIQLLTQFAGNQG